MIRHRFSASSWSRPPSRSAQLLFAFLLSVAGPSLGATGDDSTGRGFFGLTPVPSAQGLAVKSVTPGGPAQRAGILPGDLLLTLSGKPVAHLPPSEIHEIFTAFRVGEIVEIVYRRPDEGVSTARLELVSVPAPTLEQQRRIEEIDREIRASEVVKRIMAASDEFELARSESGRIRYRPDAETPWETLDPDVSDQLEPLMKNLPQNQQQVRFRIERGDDGSIQRLIRVPQPEE